MKTRSCRSILSFIAAVMLFAAVAFAQEEVRALSGTVTDPSGLRIPENGHQYHQQPNRRCV